LKPLKPFELVFSVFSVYFDVKIEKLKTMKKEEMRKAVDLEIEMADLLHDIEEMEALRRNNFSFNEERQLLETCLLGTARGRAKHYLRMLRDVARNTSAIQQLRSHYEELENEYRSLFEIEN
jgi:hypothetical protein